MLKGRICPARNPTDVGGMEGYELHAVKVATFSTDDRISYLGRFVAR